MNRMNKSPFWALIAALFPIVSHAQNLLLNGSFELPPIQLNTYYSGAPAGWAVGGISPGLIHNGNSGDAITWPLPEEGQQFVNVSNQAGTTLSQTFTIVIEGTFMLTWFDSAGHSGGQTTSPYRVAILDAFLQPITTADFDAYHSTFGAWGSRSLQLTLNPGTYTLQFRSNGVVSGLDSLIDNVSLSPATQGTTVSASIYPAVEIAWPTVSGITYQVQVTLSLEDPIWSNFGQPVLGDDIEKSVFDKTRDANKRFYRVVKLQ